MLRKRIISLCLVACLMLTAFPAVPFAAFAEESCAHTDVEFVEETDADCYDDGYLAHWYCWDCDGYWLDEKLTQSIDWDDLIIPAFHQTVHVEAIEASCDENGLMEHWYCDRCECYWLDETLTQEVYEEDIIVIAHDLVHVGEKSSDCNTEGNWEYWYCTLCNRCWLDEELSEMVASEEVIRPAAHDLYYSQEERRTCYEEGSLEHWYCEQCGLFWVDEDLTQKVDPKDLVLAAGHDVVHMEAKVATSTTKGRLEHWYCETCGGFWLDENLTQPTTRENVILPALSADENVVVGDCGDNLTWTFNPASGLLTISGEGAMESYKGILSVSPWRHHKDQIKEVIIGNGVTSIDSYAFDSLSNLTSVTIPDSVTYIGGRAFFWCTSLRSITIPDSVTVIGGYAFCGCTSLVSVTISDSIISIEDYVFEDTPYLKKITDNDGFAIANHILIGYFGKAEYVGIPDCVTIIADGAFSDCNFLTKVTIPNSVTNIGDSAFWSCSSLTSVTIPDSVTSIGGYTFQDCNSLTSVEIGSNVTSISYWVFDSCSNLHEIVFKGNPPTVHASAFSGVTSTAYYPANNATWNTDVMLDYGGTITWIPYVLATEDDDDGEDQDTVMYVRYFRKWDPDTQTAYWGVEPPMVEGLDLGSRVTSETDTSFLANVDALVGTYVLAATKPREDGMIDADVLLSIKPLETKTGTVDFVDSEKITIDGKTYPFPESLWYMLIQKGDTILYHLYEGKLIGINGEGSSENIKDDSIGDGDNETEDDSDTSEVNTSVLFYSSWDVANQTTNFGSMDFIRYQVTEKTDKAFTNDPTQYIGQYVLVETKRGMGGNDLDILISMKPVVTKSGIVDSVTRDSITIEGTTYLSTNYLLTTEQYEGKFVLCHLYQNKVTDVDILDGTECLLAVLDKENNTVGVKLYADDKEIMQYTISSAVSMATKAFLNRLPSVEYTYPTRVRMWVDSQKLIYGMEEVLFLKEIYHANKLIEDEAVNIEYLLEQINTYSPAIWILENGTADDWAAVWDSFNNVLGSLADGDEYAKYKFKQTDIYETILLNALECSAGDPSMASQMVSDMDKVFKTSKNILSVLDYNIKIKYNWELIRDKDISDLSDKQKQELKIELEKAMNESDYAYVVDGMKDASEIVTEIMKIATTAKDLVEKVMLYMHLWEVSESMASVLEQMLLETPDTYENQPMRDAIEFCAKMIQETQIDQFNKGMLLRANKLETGEYAITEAMSFFWNMVKEKAVDKDPKLLVVLVAYKLSHTVTNFAFGADNISEDLMKLKVIRSYEQYLGSAIRSLKEQFRESNSSKDAWALLDAVSLLHAFAIEDCNAAYSYTETVENTVANKIISAIGSAFDKIKEFIGKTEVSNEERKLADYAVNTREHFIRNNVDASTNWVYHLYGEFPEYYREYVELINDDWYKNALIVPVTTNYMIECPVNVFVYDKNGMLVADLTGDGSCRLDDIAAVQIGDRKMVNVRNSDQYRISCVGYDEGNMDITVSEYSGPRLLRNSKFINLVVRDGMAYHLEPKDDPFDREIHTIILDDEMIPADYDSAREKCTQHRYETAKFKWNEDYTCTAVFACVNGDSIEHSVCSVFSTTNTAMDPARRITSYTATVDFAGQKYTDTVYVVEEIFEVRDISISREYLTIERGGVATLTAAVYPAEFEYSVQWEVETGSEAVVGVDKCGNVFALKTGTGYVLASVSDGETTLTARCRIDVTEELILDGVQLNTTQAATELFSTDYAQLEILLQLPQNYSQLMNLRSGNGIAIREARFAQADVAELFALEALDDRHVRIVPRAAALENPEAVKNSYESTIVVTVGDRDYITEPLKLTVKKTLPKLKASVGSFNSFYSGQANEIQITGATVKKIRLNGDLPAWLALENGYLVLTENAPQRSGNAKIFILADTEEWAVPAALTLNVKNAYKAPALKLSASSVTLSGDIQNSVGTSLLLQCKNKKDLLADMNITGISAPEGYSISNFDAETGAFTLKAEEGFKAGSVSLNVHFSDTESTLPLKLTVKSAKVSLKLAKSSVTLNGGFSDTVSVPVNVTPADYRISDYTLELPDASQEGQIACSFENGCIQVATTETTQANASYKLRFTAAGKTVELTVKTTDKAPEVSLKASGQIDLSFPEKAALVTPNFKNYSGRISDYTWSVTESKGKTILDENAAERFQITQEGGKFYVTAKKDAALDPKNSYSLTLKLTLEGGLELPENTVKLTVKNTSVKLKLGKSKLTLNKTVSDKASVTVSCTTKGYAFAAPLWEVTDSKGNAAQKALNIGYESGILTVSLGENAAYGAIYKVLLRANAMAPAATLTVTVPTEAKSGITGSIKVSGALDVIQDGSAATVTPSYKNVTECTEMEEQLRIYSSADKYAEPVNHLFAISRNDSGAFVITKAEGAALDHTKTYKVQLVTTFNGAIIVESKQTGMKVKMGSAKLTVNAADTTLFSKDKHDRVEFAFTAKDAALNPVASVTIKDSKYQNVFEVYSYGNGKFAIGFKEGKEDSKLIDKPVTLTLNVKLQGNVTDKINTTVKLKLTIAK